MAGGPAYDYGFWFDKLFIFFLQQVLSLKS